MERLFPHPGLSYVVMACAKSGTTWMQRLLSSHPQVHCAETRLFGEYLSTENPSGIHISFDKVVSLLARHYFAPVAHEQGPEFYRILLFNFVDTIAETSRRASGKRIYGEKITPFLGTASLAVRRFHEYNPDLRFVNLVRDGRDVVVSGFSQRANARIANGGEEGDRHRAMLERREVSDYEFNFFMGMWVGAVRAGIEAASLFPNMLELRYETCLEDPEGQAARLLGFLGADASPAQVRACVEASSFERLSGGRSRGEEDRTNFFRKGVAGDWPEWLSPAQVEAFDHAAGDLLDRLGYAR